MPRYDMECEVCKNQYEDDMKIADLENAKCPECGSHAKPLITLKTPKHFSWGSWKVPLNQDK